MYKNATENSLKIFKKMYFFLILMHRAACILLILFKKVYKYANEIKTKHFLLFIKDSVFDRKLVLWIHTSQKHEPTILCLIHRVNDLRFTDGPGYSIVVTDVAKWKIENSASICGHVREIHI